MPYDKSKYEKLIRGSPLFKIDKENESAAYRRELYKMIEYLYGYLLAVNERDYEPYGSEIVEVAMRCIGSFNSSKGNFLNYFVSAWHKQYSHVLGDKLIDEKFHGLHLAEEEKRSIRKYLKLLGRIDSNMPEQEVYERISDAMRVPVKKIASIARMSNLNVSGSTILSEDGEEISLFEQISDGKIIDQQLENKDAAKELLAKIDIVFDELQERQKAMISDLITIRIWSVIEELLFHKSQYHFISKDIVKVFCDSGVMPTQRQIAEKYNRDEGSVSRAMKEFLKKLKSV